LDIEIPFAAYFNEWNHHFIQADATVTNNRKIFLCKGFSLWWQQTVEVPGKALVIPAKGVVNRNS